MLNQNYNQCADCTTETASQISESSTCCEIEEIFVPEFESNIENSHRNMLLCSDLCQLKNHLDSVKKESKLISKELYDVEKFQPIHKSSFNSTILPLMFHLENEVQLNHSIEYSSADMVDVQHNHRNTLWDSSCVFFDDSIALPTTKEKHIEKTCSETEDESDDSSFASEKCLGSFHLEWQECLRNSCKRRAIHNHIDSHGTIEFDTIKKWQNNCSTSSHWLQQHTDSSFTETTVSFEESEYENVFHCDSMNARDGCCQSKRNNRYSKPMMLILQRLKRVSRKFRFYIQIVRNVFHSNYFVSLLHYVSTMFPFRALYEMTMFWMALLKKLSVKIGLKRIRKSIVKKYGVHTMKQIFAITVVAAGMIMFVLAKTA